MAKSEKACGKGDPGLGPIDRSPEQTQLYQQRHCQSERKRQNEGRLSDLLDPIMLDHRAGQPCAVLPEKGRRLLRAPDVVCARQNLSLLPFVCAGTRPAVTASFSASLYDPSSVGYEWRNSQKPFAPGQAVPFGVAAHLSLRTGVPRTGVNHLPFLSREEGHGTSCRNRRHQALELSEQPRLSGNPVFLTSMNRAGLEPGSMGGSSRVERQSGGCGSE